jgi:hypothetical protein
MPDLKQELADVAAAIEKMEAQPAAPAEQPSEPPAAGKVRLRHPLTGDTKDVDATPAAMVPLMGLGYSQVKE